ncbi:MAG TPA: transposase [Blastocatellia bacterium]|nr:transposase [Blastocatellia bacterium]
MSRRNRSNYTAEQKVSILRRHLLDRVAVSQLCDEYKLEAAVFFEWRKQLFENGAAAFTTSGQKDESLLERKVAALEQKLTQKDEVVSELMEEHLKPKRELGEL